MCANLKKWVILAFFIIPSSALFAGGWFNASASGTVIIGLMHKGTATAIEVERDGDVELFELDNEGFVFNLSPGRYRITKVFRSEFVWFQIGKALDEEDEDTSSRDDKDEKNKGAETSKSNDEENTMNEDEELKEEWYFNVHEKAINYLGHLRVEKSNPYWQVDLVNRASYLDELIEKNNVSTKYPVRYSGIFDDGYLGSHNQSNQNPSNSEKSSTRSQNK